MGKKKEKDDEASNAQWQTEKGFFKEEQIPRFVGCEGFDRPNNMI